MDSGLMIATLALASEGSFDVAMYVRRDRKFIPVM
jgi:hypothetical protein